LTTSHDIKPGDVTSPGRKRATVLLTLGGYANTAIVLIQGLLMVPLYLEFLGPRTYGLWLASGGMLGMLWMMNFGVGSMVTQRVAHAHGQKDFAKVKAYFFNGIVVYLFIGLSYGIAGVAISMWLPEVLSIEDKEAQVLTQSFLVAVAAMTLAIINECLRSLGQAVLRPTASMVGMAVGRILGILVTVWCLFTGVGLLSIPIGLLFGEVTALVVNTLHVFHVFHTPGFAAGRVRLQASLIREYIRTSPALLLAKSGDALSRESEPLMITVFISAEATTAYMIARKAADMVFLMISVLNGAILGSFSHLVGEASPDKIEQIVRQLVLLAFAISLIGFSTYVAVNDAFLGLWVGLEYLYDPTLILIIGIGFFMRSVRGMFWQILYAVGDFTTTSLIIFAEAIIKVGMVLALLGAMGVAAVPYAIATGSVFALLALAWRLNTILEVSMGPPSIARMLISVTICAVIGRFGVVGDSWFSFAASTAFLVSLLSLNVAVIYWQSLKSYVSTGRHRASVD
jgi:O-antigen/teichoic acid export membrane protein